MSTIKRRPLLATLAVAASGIFISLLSNPARADICLPTYSGCATCYYSDSVWYTEQVYNYDTHEYEYNYVNVPFSGYDEVCDYVGSATPWLPPKVVSVNVPGYGAATAICDQIYPLPQTGIYCYPDPPTTPPTTPPNGVPTSAPSISATGYNIMWAAISGATSYQVHDGNDGSLVSTVTTTSSLQPADLCYPVSRYVQACNAVGCGPSSNTISLTGGPPGKFQTCE